MVQEPDWSRTDLTIRDVYGPAMKITDPNEARAYLEKLVRYARVNNGMQISVEEATRNQRINLGYYAGYYDHATMKRVNLLFNTVHPIFGSGSVTPQEAFELGKKMATGKLPLKLPEEKATEPKRKTRSIIID
jgi:hypothetical protein